MVELPTENCSEAGHRRGEAVETDGDGGAWRYRSRGDGARGDVQRGAEADRDGTNRKRIAKFGGDLGTCATSKLAKYVGTSFDCSA